jgi:hypothetical protein
MIARFRARVSASKNAHSSPHCHSRSKRDSALAIKSKKTRKERAERRRPAHEKTTKQQLEKKSTSNLFSFEMRRNAFSAPLFSPLGAFILTV